MDKARYPLAALLALLLSRGAFAQDLTKRVDYTTRAKALSKVLYDLSKQTGVDLECAPDLDNEPVILRLRGVPLKQAMDKIADAFAADWVKKDKSLELQWGKEADRRHSAAVQARADEIAANIHDVASHQPAAITTPEQAKQFLTPYLTLGDVPTAELSSPKARLGYGLLAKLDPKVLATMPDWTAVVFSTDPNSLQLLLPNAQADLAQFQASQNVIAPVAQAAWDKKDPFGVAEFAPVHGPLKALIRVYHSTIGQYHAEMLIGDADGNIAADWTIPVGWLYGRHSKKPIDFANTNGKVFATLGPVAREISSRIVGTNDLPLSDASRDYLLSPTENDPLVTTSDFLLDFAEKGNENLVGLAPDDAEAVACLAANNPPWTIDRFRQYLVRNNDMDLQEGDGWLVARPTDPIAAAATRLPREQLGTLVRQVADHSALGIDEQAEFFSAISPTADATLASNVLSALGSYRLWPPWRHEFAIYGRLTSEQRLAAKEGVLRLSKTDLSGELGSAVLDWVINDVLFQAPAEEEAIRERHRQLPPTPDPLPKLISQPTEMLANELPPDAALLVTDRNQTTYVFKGERFIRLHDLGAEVAESERPDLHPEVPQDKSNLVKLGIMRKVTLTFDLGTYQASSTLSEEPPATAEGISLDKLFEQLTADQRQEYQKAYDEVKAVDSRQPAAAAPPE